MILTIIVFILIFAVLVLIHEFGHFITAKKSGVKVEEFGFGLPPKLFSKKVGETEYSLNALPIGGFVRLLGEDTENENVKDPRNFASKNKKTRAAILLAGVTMNFLLAFALYTLFLYINNFQVDIPKLVPHSFRFGTEKEQVMIVDIAKGSPAENNLQVGDKILSVDKTKVSSLTNFKKMIDENKGKEVTLEVNNIEKGEREVKITPRENPPQDQGALGVKLGDITLLSYNSPIEKVFSGVLHSINIVEYTFKILGSLVTEAFKTKQLQPLAEGVGGPVAIFSLVQMVVGIGGIKALTGIIELTALLSLSLGIMNALPFPALDGGRVLFIALEVIIGKKVKPVIEKWAHTIGFMLLLGLMVLITFKDIIQIIKPHF